ncbi:BBT_HP_G0079110.mRNA.1.CDS.1 [Saccharomyces cerevisiae]|nr:BBT_HP_G0020320.mRNA.1.CDS.1 [Saccharomyces cerevisiae]CAI4941362.1 BBT_HP_G0039030.mRNA.1.CDS.1 [Saccharomyces cerevisiae]CAI4999022.1 BBT_HP_G0079110.mRNA.1.CDS.1 [Saccharomyces cerevisiae]CAI6410313.1 BBT_HP_G0020320.mRNA.1.CDS.1 [Saccharomyces cerevisiae]CAI6545487.1 BBT_HP_G0039030.mRNA.1.CDS.1 [Saccharomyces cerevisiae]
MKTEISTADSLRDPPSNGLKADSELVIREDIDQFLPSEVSSLGSDHQNDGEDSDTDSDNFLQDPEDDVDEESTGRGTVTTTSTSTESRGRPSSCIFVASLAAALSDDELCLSVTENFKKYGDLARVKVLRDNANRPYAFVQYNNDHDAKHALIRAQGTLLNGRRLRCEPAKVNRTLYLKNQQSIDFNEISQICEKFGGLEQIVPDRTDNQYTRRYTYPISSANSWFVQFVYRDDAIRAYANLRTDPNWIIEWAQNINVPKNYNLLHKSKFKSSKYHQNSGIINNDGSNNNDNNNSNNNNREDSRRNGDVIEEECGHVHGSDSEEKLTSDGIYDDEDKDSEITIDKRSIFVGQLDKETTREELNRRFSTHGKIQDINLIFKPTNIFAFIKYETEEAAAAALESENHAIFLNKTMHVQYKEVGGRHNRKFSGKNGGSNFNHHQFFSTRSGKTFTGPELNLAPPPINMYRKMSGGSQQESETMMPYMPMGPMPMGPPPPNAASLSDFDMFPPSYSTFMKGMMLLRRKSMPNSWSSPSSKSVNSENESVNGGDENSELPSEIPESSGRYNAANSFTTYNNSSAGSSNNNNNNNNSNSNKSQYKKRYARRSSYGYNEVPPKPYYFQPYYYHPMQYHMGPMGPLHPSQGSAGNHHPYMMVYPMSPPPPSGLDGSMIPPPINVGQSHAANHGSTHVHANEFISNDTGDINEDNKAYSLDY